MSPGGEVVVLVVVGKGRNVNLARAREQTPAGLDCDRGVEPLAVRIVLVERCVDDRSDLGRHRAGERRRGTGLDVLGGCARGLRVVGRDREVGRERQLLQADHGRALGGCDPDPLGQRLAMRLGIGIPGALDGRESEHGPAARLLHPRRRGESLAEAGDDREVGHDATPAAEPAA